MRMPALGVMLKDGSRPAATEPVARIRMIFAIALVSLDKLQNFGLAIVGLGLIIFLHELGHFIAAKRMGMPVEVFSIGFGPRLFGFKWRETDVRLSALPLGGYVNLMGFNPEEPAAEDPYGFLKQPFGKRMLFFSGGILMNLLVAFVLFTAWGADRVRYTAPVRLNVVKAQSVADKAGLKPKDQLLSVGPMTFPGSRWDEAVTYIRAHAEQELPVRIRRDGVDQTLLVRPALIDGVGQLGISAEPIEEGIQKRPFRLGDVGQGMRIAGEEMVQLSGMIFSFLKQAVTFKAKAADVAGPAGMVSQMAIAASHGLMPLFFFMAAISLQLGIINALPIPMLDGGHMLLLIIEKVRRKDFSAEFRDRVQQSGLIILMSLMAFVVFLDFWKMRK
jgi:regulator of sigma E protease